MIRVIRTMKLVVVDLVVTRLVSSRYRLTMMTLTAVLVYGS